MQAVTVRWSSNNHTTSPFHTTLPFHNAYWFIYLCSCWQIYTFFCLCSERVTLIWRQQLCCRTGWSPHSALPSVLLASQLPLILQLLLPEVEVLCKCLFGVSASPGQHYINKHAVVTLLYDRRFILCRNVLVFLLFLAESITKRYSVVRGAFKKSVLQLCWTPI